MLNSSLSKGKRPKKLKGMTSGWGVFTSRPPGLTAFSLPPVLYALYLFQDTPGGQKNVFLMIFLQSLSSQPHTVADICRRACTWRSEAGRFSHVSCHSRDLPRVPKPLGCATPSNGPKIAPDPVCVVTVVHLSPESPHTFPGFCTNITFQIDCS